MNSEEEGKNMFPLKISAHFEPNTPGVKDIARQLVKHGKIVREAAKMVG